MQQHNYLTCTDVYSDLKIQLYTSTPEIPKLQNMLHYDWSTVFWVVTQKQDFSETCGLCTLDS